MIQKKHLILKVERDNEDLHFPFITFKNLGKVNLPVQILRRFLNGEMNNWVGQFLDIEERKGRKYVRYFVNLKEFNFDDYQEWEIKELKKEIIK